MPNKGFKTVTLNESLVKTLAEISKNLNKTVPETVLFLTEDYLKKQQGGPQT